MPITKTMLTKQGHYLHFIPDPIKDNLFGIYYSKPSADEMIKIIFPTIAQHQDTTPYGWMKTFLASEFEEIFFVIGLEQGWDEAPWQSYPIHSFCKALYGLETPAKKASSSLKTLAEEISALQAKTYFAPQHYYDPYEKKHYQQSHSSHDYWGEAPEYEGKDSYSPLYPNTPEHFIFTEEDKKYGFVLYYDPGSMCYKITAQYAGKSYVGKCMQLISQSKTLYELGLVKSNIIKMINEDVVKKQSIIL